MDSAPLRKSTPPPYPGLLTPPSTGGRDCQRAFAQPQEALEHQAAAQQDQVFAKFFADDEASDTGTSNQGGEDDDHSSYTHSDNSSQVSVTQHTAIPAAVLTIPTSSPSTTERPSDVLTADKPFAFLKLPLPIRQHIYAHLLLIPALVCVRQKHTAYHTDPKAILYTEHRELLPGIAYALAQAKVDGLKTRFSRFAGINLNILRTSKEVFAEARAVMYRRNDFEIVKPTNELTPQPDYSIPLFPPRYQRLVARLNIRIRTFYGLDWLLSGGYSDIKHHYRGLDRLTLILELGTATKGFAREWTRRANEKWTVYVKRLHGEMARHVFGSLKAAKARQVPVWIELRVMFGGEAYCGSERGAGSTRGSGDLLGAAVTSSMRYEFVKRQELRVALAETWELFKKGGT